MSGQRAESVLVVDHFAVMLVVQLEGHHHGCDGVAVVRIIAGFGRGFSCAGRAEGVDVAVGSVDAQLEFRTQLDVGRPLAGRILLAAERADYIPPRFGRNSARGSHAGRAGGCGKLPRQRARLPSVRMRMNPAGRSGRKRRRNRFRLTRNGHRLTGAVVDDLLVQMVIRSGRRIFFRRKRNRSPGHGARSRNPVVGGPDATGWHRFVTFRRNLTRRTRRNVGKSAQRMNRRLVFRFRRLDRLRLLLLSLLQLMLALQIFDDLQHAASYAREPLGGASVVFSRFLT